MSPAVQGGMVMVVTLGMLVSGIPVAFGLGVIAIVFLILFQGFDSLHVVAETLWSGLDEFTLVAIPMFVMMGAAIGAAEMGKNPAYMDNIGRLKHRDEIIAKLSVLTSEMSSKTLLEKLETQQVPAGPINNLEQVFNDPQVVHRGMKLSLPSKVAKAGKIPGVRSPIVIDGWRAASEHPAPLLGEHTTEILREIGEA